MLLAAVIFAAHSLALFAADGKAGGSSKKTEKQKAGSNVEKIVSDHFALLKDRRPGDIISQGDVKDLGKALQEDGYPREAWEEVLRRIPADGDFLVRQFRSKAGMKVMRKVGGSAGVYDRLDVWSQLPQGKESIAMLMKAESPEKLINRLNSEEVSKDLSNNFQRGEKGSKFGQPTGKIYTQEQLVSALQSAAKQGKK